MYRLIVDQDVHILEDAQDIVEIILDSEGQDMSLYNEFDPDDIYHESIEEFMEENDLSEEPNLDTLKNKGVLLYNWETGEFDDNYTSDFYSSYNNENYRSESDIDVLKSVASQEDCHIGTVVIVEGGYSAIFDGKRLVSRDGYIVYKSKEKISDSEYYYI